MSRLSIQSRSMVLLRAPEYRSTGMLTRPNVIAPFQRARAMAALQRTSGDHHARERAQAEQALRFGLAFEMALARLDGTPERHEVEIQVPHLREHLVLLLLHVVPDVLAEHRDGRVVLRVAGLHAAQ